MHRSRSGTGLGTKVHRALLPKSYHRLHLWTKRQISTTLSFEFVHIMGVGESVRRSPLDAAGIRPLRVIHLTFREARPAVQMIFLLRFLTGALLVGAAAPPPWKSVVIAAALWMCATVTIYLVNGVSDVVEDSANKSSRPIASGALAPRTAAAVAAVAAVVASAGAALSGNLCAVLLTVAMLTVGCAYSMGPLPLKRRMSGFLCTVTIGGLLTYLAGWNSTGAAAVDADLAFFAAAMSLWMAFGGATKDLSDIDGDRLAGRRTWPVVLGERRAQRTMAGTAMATGAGFAVAALLVVPGLWLPAATLLTGSVLLAVTATSQRSGGARNTRRRPYRIFMVTQYATHLALLTQFTL